MICQATYDSLDAIPEALRDEFEQKNARWQLKESAVPGAGPLFNSALAANEQKAVGQVKTRNEKIKALEDENNTLKDKLAVVDVPGHKVLSKEDAALFEQYTKLGTPKDLETKLSTHEQLATKVKAMETKDAMSKIAGMGNLNPDVLADWANSPEAKGVTFFTKSVEQTDAKGAKTTVEVPYVKIEKNEDGTIKVTEKELLPFAKEVMPEWKYAALTATVNGKPSGNGGSVRPASPPQGGVKLPDLGSSSTTPTPDASARPVDKFNEERAKAPNPFTKPMMPMAGR